RESFLQEERRLSRISLRFSIVRGILFTVFVGFLLWILFVPESPKGLGFGVAALFFVAFLAVLPRHDRIVAAQRRAGDLARINEEGLLRIARDWKSLPVPSFSSDLPLARDLDLFGPASLFQLLGTAHTPSGKSRLAGWLLEPAPPAEILLRQEAVTELAPELDLRQQIEVRTRPMEKHPPSVDKFLSWAEDKGWLVHRPWLVWPARILPLLTIAALIHCLLRFQQLPEGTPVAQALMPTWQLGLLLLVNLTLAYAVGSNLLSAFDRLEAREKEFQLYADALALLPERSYRSAILQRIAADLAPQGRPAHRWMEVLQGRIGLANARHSGLLHFFLQIFLLWDFHSLYLLEAWQRDAGPYVRKWLSALADFEALSALAGLHHDNPDWVFPRVEEGQGRYAATSLGHPLLPGDRRVSNDVEIGPAGTFLLVTGSNMSGKSTLLRSIGVNAVLAQAGGPVCAGELRMPPVTLATCILVEDSLADGVSFFLAELKRIRGVVDIADRSHAEGRTVLYLLDEILRGTNSQERQVAVRRVILHLLRQGAVGAVSTHDLQIAEIPELADAVRPVNFRETLHPGGDPPMTFDYQMRPGVATTTNALRLMELVGLRPE
ncbi:MAG TPA: DNA mismatch repair protein MutS, partial [Thermoanaerobaculia bacterium]|nr:DNA mismatch repair protein MutS [Thermoanaerobaculia bacterium]